MLSGHFSEYSSFCLLCFVVREEHGGPLLLSNILQYVKPCEENNDITFDRY